jgi:hypothetical protein
MKAKHIVLNGKTYRSMEEMPPDVREKYELAMSLLDNTDEDRLSPMDILADRNKNGTPDILESITTGENVTSSLKIIVDGKEYSDMEHLPSEARTRVEEALGKLDANRNGVPDFIEAAGNLTNQTTNISTDFGAGTSPRQASTPVSPGMAPDTDISNAWTLAPIGFLLFVLCAAGAAGLWYFFLR